MDVLRNDYFLFSPCFCLVGTSVGNFEVVKQLDSLLADTVDGSKSSLDLNELLFGHSTSRSLFAI